MSLTSEQREFIDDFSALWDQFGGNPAQGRILALLYVSERAEMNATEIVEALGISRGSVSQTTRQLVQLRLVQRVSKPGDRRDYYRVDPNAWSEAARADRTRIGPFLKVLRRGITIHSTSPPDRQRPLINSIAFLEDYDAALGAFLETWKPRKEMETE